MMDDVACAFRLEKLNPLKPENSISRSNLISSPTERNQFFNNHSNFSKEFGQVKYPDYSTVIWE